MKQTYQGSCHCGRVRFEVDADIDHVRVCDCSICQKRGALIYRVAEGDLRLLTALDDLTLYQWGTHTAKDYFCPTCGILPFRRPRHTSAAELAQGNGPFSGWAVNTRCLQGFNAGDAAIKNVSGRAL